MLKLELNGDASDRRDHFKYKVVSPTGLRSNHGWVSSSGHPSKECPTSS